MARSNHSWCQLCNWGPLLALSTIAVISISAIYCDLMWWPISTWRGLLHLAVFLLTVTMILTNYFRAALLGPGFVPLKWRPPRKKDEKFLQFCPICLGYKAPRSHHCRKCDRCVMKMDHHCPWIGTCAGHENQTHFLLFLFWAPMGCCHALVILVMSMYRALNLHYYVFHGIDFPLVQLGVWSFIACMFASGLAVGVVIAVGLLFVMEFKAVLRNRTGIEDWIVEKANDRLHNTLLHQEDLQCDSSENAKTRKTETLFQFPYDLGWRSNLTQVINWSMQPEGDGLVWVVAPGCNQYSLTHEQLMQKAEKRQRTVVYHTVTKYGGSCFPISFGVRVLWGIPCTDEPRLTMALGEEVHVTRWKRHWLYGMRLETVVAPQTLANGNYRNGAQSRLSAVQKEGEKGWFPRLCVTELYDGKEDDKKKD